MVGLATVRAAVEERAQQRRAGRDDHEVRAHVGQDSAPVAPDLAVLVGGELDLLDLVPAVMGGQVVLRTGLHPLHRAAQALGQRQAQGFLRVDLELRSEPAADLGGDDPQLGLGDPRRDGHGHPDDVRDLGGRPHRELAGDGVGRPEEAAGLDRIGDQAGQIVTSLDDHRGIGERLVDVAIGERPRVGLVRPEVLVQDRRVGVLCLRHVDEDGERLVVDLDGLTTVARRAG